MAAGKLVADSIQSTVSNTPPRVNASGGTEVGQFCRAWVNFNGTGTVAIRDSFNVSSITDNGAGDYTVNFTNALPNANYTCSFDVGGSAGRTAAKNNDATSARTTSALRALFYDSGTGTATDYSVIGASVFADS